MYVVCVRLWVKAGFEDRFVAATREIHLGTRKELGNVRFDVMQREDDASEFLLYEVYNTKDDFVRHQQTPHYLAWKETVAEWMAKDREGTKYHSLFPRSSDW